MPLVGNAEGRDNAVVIARNMVQHIEQAAAKGEWPQIEERFIRPGAIGRSSKLSTQRGFA